MTNDFAVPAVVCCLSPLPETRIRTWLPSGVELRMVDPTQGEEHVRAGVARATIVIGDWLHRVALDRSILQLLAPGAFVQQPSVGFDEVDVAAADDLGVTVSNAAGYNATAVAEWVIGAFYSLVRGLHWRSQAIRAGHWPVEAPARELSSLNLGLLGFGNIGRTVATRLGPVVRDVLCYDLRGSGGLAAQVDLAELLQRSDVLSVQLPLTPQTKGLLGAHELRQMPSGSFLISAGRGGVVDERDLAAVINDGHLGGAALDVFEQEPITPDNPLLAVDRVLLSPHIAGETVDADERLVEVIQANVTQVLNGRRPDHVIGGPI